MKQVVLFIAFLQIIGIPGLATSQKTGGQPSIHPDPEAAVRAPDFRLLVNEMDLQQKI